MSRTEADRHTDGRETIHTALTTYTGDTKTLVKWYCGDQNTKLTFFTNKWDARNLCTTAEIIINKLYKLQYHILVGLVVYLLNSWFYIMLYESEELKKYLLSKCRDINMKKHFRINATVDFRFENSKYWTMMFKWWATDAGCFCKATAEWLQ